PNWPADGRAICTASDWQWFPAITEDGAGGAIISWEDSRSGQSNIYAQRVTGTGTLVDVPTTEPLSFRLYMPFPTPSRGGRMTIRFDVPVSEPVSVMVLDLVGRHVRTLEQARLQPGPHELRWDGRDQTGVQVPNGIYFVQVSAAAHREVRKVIVLE